MALIDKSGRDEGKGMIVVERNGMLVSSAVARNESTVERNDSIALCNGRDVARNECDVDESRRDANGTGSDARCSVRDVDGKQRIVDPSGGGVTSDVAHSIFQLATLARKRFAQHFQPEGNWTSHLQHSLRSMILIRVMRVRYLMMILFNSSTHFICNMVD